MGTSYGLGDRGLTLAGQEIFLFPTASRPTLEPAKPLIQRVPAISSPGVKRPGHEGDRSPSSSAEIKNDESIPSLPCTSSFHVIV
jgi:hypothetical protein